jgi:hypothetical protein
MYEAKGDFRQENGSALNMVKIDISDDEDIIKLVIETNENVTISKRQNSIEKSRNMNPEKSVAEVSGNEQRLKREKSSEKARRIKPANSVEKMRHSKRDESAEKMRQLKQDMSLPLQSIQLTNNLGGIVYATFCDHVGMKKK